MPRYLVGLNDAIINLQITLKLPFGFTQLATQGNLEDKLRNPFCVKVGPIHVNRDIINISQITINITSPVLKSRNFNNFGVFTILLSYFLCSKLKYV